MKAAMFYGPGDVRVESVPDPGAPGPDEVALRVEMGALCGTDASLFKAGRKAPLPQPFILGHEITGVVVEKGRQVRNLVVGQRVVPGSGRWCSVCASCRAGRFNICEAYQLLGRDANGGLAEYATYPALMCVPVPEGCPAASAVLAQPLAVALHALRRGGIRAGQTAAIYGAGSIGSLLMAALSAELPDVRIIALDLDASRLETARCLGATCLVNVAGQDPVATIGDLTGGQGAEVVIDATGEPDTIAKALISVCRGGTLVQVGIPSRPVPLPLDQAVLAERDIITTNGLVAPIDLPQALQLLSATDLAARLGPRTIALDALVEEGLRPLAEHRAAAKVVVRVASSSSREVS